LKKVIGLSGDKAARQLASRCGLEITVLAWEDNARKKQSVWGPCISDMTLSVQNAPLPIFRYKNYTDLTWDIPLEKIPLVVGNELDGKLYTVTLKEYLQTFKMYLSDPTNWAGSRISLLGSKENYAICSAQACILPVPKNGEAVFNVSIYNYRSTPRNPAVLAIVSTAEGTSAQVVEGDTFSGSQKLYFNQKGERASFVGQRLSDNRKDRGVKTEGAMTSEEKKQNAIMIIQVPLKQDYIRPSKDYYGDGFGGGVISPAPVLMNGILPGGCFPMPYPQQVPTTYEESVYVESRKAAREKSKVDMEEAIIKVGKVEGKFNEVNGLAIERDPDYPVRVTFQFYKSTATGVINEAEVSAIADQIATCREQGDFIGSLVVGGITKRPTEPKTKSQIPVWWDTFWYTYSQRYPHITKDVASVLLFSTGRFTNMTMDEAQGHCLAILNQQTQVGI